RPVGGGRFPAGDLGVEGGPDGQGDDDLLGGGTAVVAALQRGIAEPLAPGEDETGAIAQEHSGTAHRDLSVSWGHAGRSETRATTFVPAQLSFPLDDVSVIGGQDDRPARLRRGLQ